MHASWWRIVLKPRLAVPQEFNKGIFDHLIATDDPARRAAAADEARAAAGGAAARPGEAPAEKSRPGPSDGTHYSGKKRARAPEAAGRKAKQARGGGAAAMSGDSAEFGVVRGIDFKGVRTVINVDAPESVSACPMLIHWLTPFSSLTLLIGAMLCILHPRD